MSHPIPGFQGRLINLESGMMSAAASLGLSLLWDTDMGLTHVDKYTYSSEEHIKASTIFPRTVWGSDIDLSRLVLFSQQVFLTQASAPRLMPR